MFMGIDEYHAESERLNEEFLAAFHVLEKVEDKVNILAAQVTEYKEGRKLDMVKKNLRTQQDKLVTAGRAFRLAGIHLDRLNQHIKIDSLPKNE